MPDEYANRSLSVSSPVRKAVSVSPDDNTDLVTVSRALWIGVEGDIEAILAENDTSESFKGVVGLFPFMVKRVLATGTTATSILALN